MTREALREELKKLIQSSLEVEFVDWLYDHGYRLPDKAQVLIEDPYARPDFFYEIGKGVLVYVDGPSHESANARQRDDIDRQKLERSGYEVVSVTYPARWSDEVADWPDVFGEGVKR
jgi:very-short-patch-repair endonuclease